MPNLQLLVLSYATAGESSPIRQYYAALVGQHSLGECVASIQFNYKFLLFWHLVNGEGPPSLRKCIPTPAIQRAGYSFRRGQNTSFPRCSTNWRLNSFIPSAVALRNSLPSSVPNSSSSSSFLSQLDHNFSSDKFSLGLPQ